MIDMNALVSAYQAEAITIPALAARFGIKPADAGAYLRLNGVKLRRGGSAGASNLTADARAKGQQVRSAKSLSRIMKKLIDKHGMAAVGAAFDKEAGI